MFLTGMKAAKCENIKYAHTGIMEYETLNKFK